MEYVKQHPNQQNAVSNYKRKHLKDTVTLPDTSPPLLQQCPTVESTPIKHNYTLRNQ
jgi:hypothetical protein